MKITILDGKGEGRRVACCNVTLPCSPSLSQPPCSVFPVVVIVFVILMASQVFLRHLSPLSALNCTYCFNYWLKPKEE